MSNKTQLQTNNTALDGYIARINAAKETAASLPNAGGGSGGGVETCTVIFNNQLEENLDIYGTYYENGSFYSFPTTAYDMSSTEKTVTKNSFIVIPYQPVTVVDVGAMNPIMPDTQTVNGATIVAVGNYELIQINIID